MIWTRSLAALFMASAVALGAFGAHGLRSALPPERLVVDMAIWEKAVLYSFVHALAALWISSISQDILPEAQAKTIARIFIFSTLIFSGSLYLLVATNQRWLGMVTPLGGLGLLAGWLYCAYSLARKAG